MNRGNNLVMTVGRVRLLLVLMVISLGLWILFAKLLVPPIIESAYRGESWFFLNRLIRGQATHPVSEYLQDWDRMTIRALLSGLGFWLVTMVLSHPAFFRRFVGEATPGSLGAIRMLTCLTLLLATGLEDLPSIALLPPEIRDAGGIMKYLYALPIGFDKFVTSETAIRTFQSFTELVLFLGVIGCGTRLVIPIGMLCTLVIQGILRDYSFYWHQNLVPFYVMIVLSCTPCGDGWSVDRLWKIYQGKVVPDADRPSPVYGWSRYACWTMIALPYVANGLGKLQDGGLFWWDATNLRTNLYADTLAPREFDWAFSLYLAHAPDILFSAMGLFTLFGETLFGLVLFSGIARRIFPLAAITMHIGILLLQRILFFDLMLLQLVFFDFTPLRKAIGLRLARERGRLQVFYDGLCPLCCGTVRLLTGVDLFGRLEFLDFRRLHHDALPPAVTVQDLEAEMYVVFQGKAYRGFYGYRRIALAVPLFWPLAPWLFLPGISYLGVWVYGYVARNRLKFLWCDAHCPAPLSPNSELAQVATRRRVNRGIGIGYAMAISGIAVITLLCLYYRVEFYPLTSWHLYSGLNRSGKVEYLKVLGRYESGETSRARFEDGIGALALDMRYWRALDMCIDEKAYDPETCKKFLTAEAAAYNKRAREGRKLTAYEVQVWVWDFLSSPVDPHYGKMTSRFVFDMSTGQLLREPTPEDRVVRELAAPVVVTK